MITNTSCMLLRCGIQRISWQRTFCSCAQSPNILSNGILTAHSKWTPLRASLRTSLQIPLKSPLERAFSSGSPRLTRSDDNYKDEIYKLQKEAMQLRQRKRITNGLLYSAALVLVLFGLGYASVPLYRAFCQKTGYAGTINPDVDRFAPENMIPVEDSDRITITFNGDVSPSLQWSLRPQQRAVHVKPGETALAFFTATNRGSEDVTGIATYSVTPMQVAEYFSKVACFCFEEQRLNAGETVDMPVFFFIDPEYASDPRMKDIKHITLSYTFFKAKYDDDGNLKQPPGTPMKLAPAIA